MGHQTCNTLHTIHYIITEQNLTDFYEYYNCETKVCWSVLLSGRQFDWRTINCGFNQLDTHTEPILLTASLAVVVKPLDVFPLLKKKIFFC